MQRKTYLILAIFGLAVMLLADSLLISLEYRQYKEKVELLERMITGEEQGLTNLEIATRILKGERDITPGEGREILGAYGYQSAYQDVYYRQWKRQIRRIGIGSTLFYMVYLLLILGLKLQQERRKHREYDEFEQILLNFRAGSYKIMPEILPSIQEDTDRNRIYIQAQSLGNYLQLMEERMLREKEGTKALVTDISHQLKTPVAALKTCFEVLLQEDLSREERKEFSMRCSQQLKGLEDLLQALINISRLETGMIQLKRENGCVYETLVLAVNRVYLKAQEKGIEIELEAEEAMQSLSLPHDSKWLCEALINLLDNAVKYSPPGTCITLRMMARTNFLRIEIEDQGIGIAKEEYHQIFQRFYRGKSETVKKTAGSGVGLYLTREIISMHRGNIAVAPVLPTSHTGTIFVIQLPYQF